MNVSVVIPTRNRLESLRKTLHCIRLQTLKPYEVIVVDASDPPGSSEMLIREFDTLPLRCMNTPPSVCIQRNSGIYAASGDWIFLCDDDITFESHYLETLVAFAHTNHSGAVSGLWMQHEGKQWQAQYRVTKIHSLLWAYIFQLSLWGEISVARPAFMPSMVFNKVLAFYQRRGNSTTRAGWPLITDFSAPFMRTRIYSLGACLVKRAWLIESPFDEVLDRSGIGDNYGVEMGFPGEQAILVLTTLPAYHHRSPDNRLPIAVAYYRRLLALHYFLSCRKRPQFGSVRWFVWSLIGNAIRQVVQGDIRLACATAKVCWLVFSRRNPYVRGSKNNKKVIEPFV